MVGAVDVAVRDVERAVVGVVGLGVGLLFDDLVGRQGGAVGGEHRVKVGTDELWVILRVEVVRREGLAVDRNADGLLGLLKFDLAAGRCGLCKRRGREQGSREEREGGRGASHKSSELFA